MTKEQAKRLRVGDVVYDPNPVEGFPSFRTVVAAYHDSVNFDVGFYRVYFQSSFIARAVLVGGPSMRIMKVTFQ